MIREGSNVKWKWGNGSVQGEVIETYDSSVDKTIKSNKVTRHGEPGNKALYIKSVDGDYALKLESEVTHVKK